MTSSPGYTDPVAIFFDLQRRARRVETPCGDGVLVWRAWGSGPPVVLAHGSHGSWAHWIRNIDVLAERRTVWAVDLPGWGESALPPRLDHDSFTAVLAAGLRQTMPNDVPIDFVGFSFGGVIGAHLAARYPELVRRLILVGTGGLDTPVGHVELHRVRGLEGEARKAAMRANLLGLMLHQPASADDLALHIQATYAFNARLDPTPLVLPDKLLQALPHIQAPVDAIWGEHDRPHPPAPQEPVLRRFDRDLQFKVIADAGHWAMYEQPAQFNRVLIELLDRPLRQRSK